ncbi:hypothetical protein FRZ61_40460 [Hypericibacter adhaerens]|uniref:Uncharacterized protein n=1 Tax=Hypericibacter adhaerens TaxID=2602016 RepID=A0A5J6N5F1_9PROT|nr:hypothetical protein FRZ61_40460 [Hypericibacter adhaerens]
MKTVSAALGAERPLQFLLLPLEGAGVGAGHRLAGHQYRSAREPFKVASFDHPHPNLPLKGEGIGVNVLGSDRFGQRRRRCLAKRRKAVHAAGRDGCHLPANAATGGGDGSF